MAVLNSSYLITRWLCQTDHEEGTAKVIGEAMKRNDPSRLNLDRLQWVGEKCNGIGDEGVKAVAEAFEHYSSLT